jgi:hypothetical protein
MMGQPLLLIAGIPATGKSHFGRWLAREHEYVHVDIEEAGRLESLRLGAAWNACFQTGDVSLLVAELRALGPHVVLDWGFPPEWLHVVREMKGAGVDIWWLDGDRARAREEFVKRRTVPVSALDVQMTKIQSRWADIQDLFGSNRIDVIASNGQRMPPEEMWRRIAALSDRGHR